MDGGELLWLTTHSPRGDHETLWAPCWKSSMASGIDFRAPLLCMRQLQLCSSGPWLGSGDILVGDRQRRIFHCHLEAAAQQILCSYRCVTFRTKQPLRAAVAGEVDFTASFALRIDWSQDLHKQSPVGSCWCWCFSCLTPALLRVELGMNLLHSRGRGSDTGGESCLRCLWIKQEGSPGDSNPCRRNPVRCVSQQLPGAFQTMKKMLKTILPPLGPLPLEQAAPSPLQQSPAM